MIGELDLFQKEHELSTLLAKCKPASEKMPLQHHPNSISNGQLMDFPTSTTGSVHSTDEIDATMQSPIKAPATPYEGQSIGSGSAENGSFNGSFDEDVASNGFENPSFRYLHQNHEIEGFNATVPGSQEIVHIQDEELSGNTQKYLQDNSEIVTLRCKDTQRQSMEKNYASIGLGGIGNDNLIVQPGKGRASHGGGDGVGDAKARNNHQHQRLSSFKVDVGQQLPQQRSSLDVSTSKRNHSQNDCVRVVTCPVDQEPHQAQKANGYVYSGTNNEDDLSAMELSAMPMVVQVSPDGKIRSKPTVSPRPTSLSGSFFFCFFKICWRQLICFM